MLHVDLGVLPCERVDESAELGMSWGRKVGKAPWLRSGWGAITMSWVSSIEKSGSYLRYLIMERAGHGEARERFSSEVRISLALAIPRLTSGEAQPSHPSLHVVSRRASHSARDPAQEQRQSPPSSLSPSDSPRVPNDPYSQSQSTRKYARSSTRRAPETVRSRCSTESEL